MSRTLFTSESVTEGHPDKIADQISDSILDHLFVSDPQSRVACETLVTTGLTFVAGEISTEAYVHIPDIVRGTLSRIGYTNAVYGIDALTCAVLTSIDQQSSDIAMGVDTGGAGDQGMMFGYATNETPELMPAPIQYAHAITRQLAHVRKTGEVPWLRPDGKSQITVEYEDGRPRRIHTVVVSAQHSEDVRHSEIVETLIKKVIEPVLPEELVDDHCIFHINPTGRFVTGGPHGDAGLTGRKIIVDTYGGVGRHGGGAFSGKDPTKVDRSAAYAARWAAKNVVAAGLATRCEIQLAYSIGVAEPVSILVTNLRDAEVSKHELARAVSEVFDLTPAGIIDRLGLRAPIYTSTAAYGHFGRTPERKLPDAGGDEAQFFPWELTDRVDDLRNALGG